MLFYNKTMFTRTYRPKEEKNQTWLSIVERYWIVALTKMSWICFMWIFLDVVLVQCSLFFFLIERLLCWMFCPLGRLIPHDVLLSTGFVLSEVLSIGQFELRDVVFGRFVHWKISPLDILPYGCSFRTFCLYLVLYIIPSSVDCAFSALLCTVIIKSS